MSNVSKEITKVHFNLLLWLITILGGALISVTVYSYLGEIENQEKHHGELMQVIVRNQNELAEIKKFILVRFGFDIDNATDQHEWERLMREFESSTRGGKKETYIPDNDDIIARQVYK